MLNLLIVLLFAPIAHSIVIVPKPPETAGKAMSSIILIQEQLLLVKRNESDQNQQVLRN